MFSKKVGTDSEPFPLILTWINHPTTESKTVKKSSDQNQLIFHFIHQDQCRWNRQILLSGSFLYFLSCMYTSMLDGHFKLCKVSNNGWFWIVNHGTLLCQKLGIILSPHWTDCIQHFNSTVSFTERKQMDIMAVRNFLIFHWGISCIFSTFVKEKAK